ncbi:MAG: YqiA/YcfP family alpha/beta fold hydrolase [Pseudomonadota bacterium]
MKHLMVFSHGLDSSPQAHKIQWLEPRAAAAGWQTLAPDYQDQDPEQRVATLETAVADQAPDRCVLVGSSLGGVVSVFGAQRFPVAGLFVMVPAVFWPGYEHLSYEVTVPVIEVVHAWRDDVVPLERVQRWAELHAAPLHVLPDEHRLANSRDPLISLFDHFLARLDGTAADAAT